MTGDTPTPRERAEKRVHDRLEKQRSRLFRQQQKERQDMLRRQQAERAGLENRMKLVAERRKEVLGKHDREWERERQRLANNTRRMPGLGLFGSPHRNLQAEYHERRTRWANQRAVIEDAFEQQRDRLQNDRIDMAERHTTEKIARESVLNNGFTRPGEASAGPRAVPTPRELQEWRPRFCA
ncbi:hypothetical protein C2I36_12920 [Rhodobacteraceae bacterium WD3A24]|nr:hypothetical protein C2I36_12920 [Rhodobacteraceae bacterium WD3A24]